MPSGHEDSRLPADLTEWKFRQLWDQTEASSNYSGHKANTEAAKQDELRRFRDPRRRLPL